MLYSHIYKRRITKQKVTEAAQFRQTNVFNPLLNCKIDMLGASVSSDSMGIYKCCYYYYYYYYYY